MTATHKGTLIFILLLLPCLLYMNTIRNGFVFDDKFVLELNPYVRDIGNIPSYFISSKTQSSYDMKNYRPLRQVMFTLEYQLFGLTPAPYHLLNILFHALNGVLLFLLFCRLDIAPRLAFFAATLFAAHPINTEAVANITGRTDLLFFFFYALGLLLYLKSRESKNPVALKIVVLTAYILALFSKEMAITFPLVLALTDLYRERGNLRNLKEKLPYYLTLIVISIVYLSLRTYALEGIAKDASALYGDSISTRLISQTAIFITYLKLVVIPTPLSARYDLFLLESPLNPYTGLFAVLSITLLTSTIACLTKRRFPLPLFGCWWFLIALLPVSNLIPLQGAMMGERFLYLPLAGLLIAIVYAAERLSCKSHNWGERPLAILFVIVLAAFSALTVNRNAVWRDNVTLLEDTAKKAPDSLVIHWNLFEEYKIMGDTEKAGLAYGNMKRINGETALRYLEMAKRYLKEGKKDDAMRLAKKAVTTKPDYAEAQELMAMIGGKLAK